MSISISELYGKRIISNEGRVIGEVQGVMLNLEDGAVSHLLLTRIDKLQRSGDLKKDLQKNSIAYKRVKKISETIIVGKETSQ